MDHDLDPLPVSDSLQERFRAAMRGTASGVAVLTSDGPAGRAGVTVSTLCSLSLEPPSVIACVNQASRAMPAIMANRIFAANVLAEDQSAIAEIFSGHTERQGEERFDVAEWGALLTGAPILEGAIASFDCRLAQTFDFGSHRILIGEVIDVATRKTKPLVYSGRMFQRLRAG